MRAVRVFEIKRTGDVLGSMGAGRANVLKANSIMIANFSDVMKSEVTSSLSDAMDSFETESDNNNFSEIKFVVGSRVHENLDDFIFVDVSDKAMHSMMDDRESRKFFEFVDDVVEDAVTIVENEIYDRDGINLLVSYSVAWNPTYSAGWLHYFRKADNSHLSGLIVRTG